jgi:hypothetical protein
MQSSRTPFAVALTALALAAPAAQAHPAAPDHNSPSVSNIEAQALASHGKSAPVRHAPRVASSDPGFDWASAGVGGGGVVAIALLASLAVAGAGSHGRVRTAR